LLQNLDGGKWRVAHKRAVYEAHTGEVASCIADHRHLMVLPDSELCLNGFPEKAVDRFVISAFPS